MNLEHKYRAEEWIILFGMISTRSCAQVRIIKRFLFRKFFAKFAKNFECELYNGSISAYTYSAICKSDDTSKIVSCSYIISGIVYTFFWKSGVPFFQNSSTLRPCWSRRCTCCWSTGSSRMRRMRICRSFRRCSWRRSTTRSGCLASRTEKPFGPSGSMFLTTFFGFFSMYCVFATFCYIDRRLFCNWFVGEQ